MLPMLSRSPVFTEYQTEVRRCFQSLLRQMLGQCIKFGCDIHLPRAFQIIIHQTSDHSTLYNSGYRKIVTNYIYIYTRRRGYPSRNFTNG